MDIKFWGAAQTVTGSAHYLSINGHNILLDCGLYQGKRKLAAQINREFALPPAELDAVILSHAHIDHSGNLPNLYKLGYQGPVYATSATTNLAKLMLMDSAHIQESDVRYVNKRRIKRGETPVEPLYTTADAELCLDYFEPRELSVPFDVAPGVVARFVEAGHILGSAAIVLDVEEKSGEKKRLWFSGDIGRRGMPLLEDPILPTDTDYLIMESTYGDKSHASYKQACEQLTKVISETINRNGKVIIPAFAVGRTQELVYAIHRMMDAGEIPSVPVFVDSPLAVKVTDVFRSHPEYFDEEALKMLREDAHRAVLGFDMLTYIRSVDESKELNKRDDPMIIISASGMMEVGRVLHHLRHAVHDPNSTVLIVSWMAPHTLGRRLVEGQEQIKIYGEVYDRKIQVARIDGFSAHAGQELLVEYALNLKGRVQDVFFVHGEERGALPLMEKLREQGMENLHYPSKRTVFTA
ncbi:MAG: MBL fold metallo-hydrolase [Chloroflexota bacterium]